MITLIYVLLGILSLVLLIAIRDYIKTQNRKSECKNWHVGDMLILDKYNGNDAYRILNESRKSYAILKGWSLDSIYVDVHDGNVFKIEWCEMKENKSAIWRKNYEEAKKVMGSDPSFTVEVTEPKQKSSNTRGGTIDGRPIELLSEVECEVYLKQAIEAEDYKAAEQIRNRMEHFR